MWTKKAFSCLLLAVLCLFVLDGCSLDEAKENIEAIKSPLDTVTPFVPLSHRWIPVGISTLLTGALGIIKALRERKRGDMMKEAIEVTASVIDEAKMSSSEEIAKAAMTTCRYIDAKKHNPDPGRKKALNTFNLVRKGILV